MRIERLISFPPEQFWQALIRDAEVTEHGAQLRLASLGACDTGWPITRYQAPTLLECRRAGSVLRWELAPRGDGTTLVVFTRGVR